MRMQQNKQGGILSAEEIARAQNAITQGMSGSTGGSGGTGGTGGSGGSGGMVKPGDKVEAQSEMFKAGTMGTNAPTQS